jgi:hypothetical protein
VVSSFPDRKARNAPILIIRKSSTSLCTMRAAAFAYEVTITKSGFETKETIIASTAAENN